MDIHANLATYLGARSPTDRYASFDYCFNYFQSHYEAGILEGLADGEGMQLSCLQLGFYLASWGMYRGSTILLHSSLKQLEPVIKVIADCPQAIWTADANDYTDEATNLILEVAQRLCHVLPAPATDTLVTKVMLGVFGCVPAFDTNFCRGSKHWTFGPAALRWIANFYQMNAEIIDAYGVPTLDFITGESTGRLYSRAKVIDMISFVEGAG